jgi:hypothetical protein
MRKVIWVRWFGPFFIFWRVIGQMVGWVCWRCDCLVWYIFIHVEEWNGLRAKARRWKTTCLPFWVSRSGEEWRGYDARFRNKKKKRNGNVAGALNHIPARSGSVCFFSVRRATASAFALRPWLVNALYECYLEAVNLSRGTETMRGKPCVC